MRRRGLLVGAMVVAGLVAWRASRRTPRPAPEPAMASPPARAAPTIPRFVRARVPTADAAVDARSPDARDAGLAAEGGRRAPVLPGWRALVGPNFIPVTVSANKYVDFTQAELEALARRCELRWDVPFGLFERQRQLSAASAAEMGLTEEERAGVNRALETFVEATYRELRLLQVELTGDVAATARLSADQLLRTLVFTSAGQHDIIVRLAWERAGKLPPPDDPRAVSPRERALRRMVEIGDEWEEVLAAQAGRERAHALRLATTWGLGRRYWGQPDCP